jgi:hypothetical protein
VYGLNQLPLLLLPQALQQQRLPVNTRLLLQLLLAACLNKLCINAKSSQPAAQPAQHAVNQEAGLHAAGQRKGQRHTGLFVIQTEVNNSVSCSGVQFAAATGC